MAENKEVQEGKIFAVLAYLGILCIIPLAVKKDNKFALHHGKQGLVIFLGFIALGVIALIPILGTIVAFIGCIVLLIFAVIGIVQALIGNYWKCPVVSDIADKIKI